MSLKEFCDWVATTPVSQFIQDTSWAVPATQTVHLLALSTVFFLMAVFDLQVMGVLARPQAPGWSRRPLPWLWGGLAVLAASGLILVIGEPERELFNWPFRIKMMLIVAAALLTVVLARAAAKPTPSAGTRITAAIVLVCWIVIVIAGRWIAYFNFGEG